MENERPVGRRTRRMLSTLVTCPRRYEIEYVKNLRLKGRRGDLWPPNLKAVLRDALRDRDYAEMRGLSKVRVRAAAEAVFIAYRDELTNLIGNVARDEYERLATEIIDIEEAARGILGHYEETLGGGKFNFLLDPSGQPIVDRIVEQDLDGTYTYAGRIDGVLDRGEEGPAVLIRHLTSNTDPSSVVRDLEMDLSIMESMWLASRVAGTKVTSAVVEVVRTKAPSVPETIQCRKCKGAGKIDQRRDDGTFEEGKVNLVDCPACGGSGIGGMSKRPCDTTPEEWHRAVVRAGLDVKEEEARCSDVLSRIVGKGETFAYRINIETSEEAILAWKQDTTELSYIGQHHATHGGWPRNASACTGRSAPCPYRKVCSHHGDTDSAWFTAVQESYPGLD